MALQAANARLQAGEFAAGNRVYLVRVGAALTEPADVGNVVVATRGGAPIYLRDVASVAEEFGERTDYVSHAERGQASESAVTMSVAKRPGANATTVAHGVLERVEAARARLLPAAVGVSVTRNYGETASEKANELILHLLIATVSVTILVALFLGWREALVVLVAVPVTLALTLFVYYAMGYSLNRITLFALIFSIGILVDDAIVVVENIYRHLVAGDKDPETAAVEGVDEVGNPTILATFTVIAAILPMAFVSGPHGSVHAPDPGRRLGGDARLARGGVHHHAVPRAPPAAWSREGAGRQRGSTAERRALRAAVRPPDDRTHGRPPAAVDLLRHGWCCCWRSRWGSWRSGWCR